MTLAQVLNAERERQARSILEVARAAGVPVSRAHGVFTGETPDPRFSTLSKLVAALGKSLAWLERELNKPAA
jgi:DNA-binding phage protein